MLNVPEDIAIVVICVVVALGFLWLLRRFWPSTQRREHNDIIGWQVSVLGTTYAVIMGFMLYAVWSDFHAAEMTVDAEANSLVNLFRIADGLPATQRDEIQKLSRDYANAMLNEEWPAMNEGSLSPDSHRIIQQLWTTLLQSKPASLSEQTSFDQALTELTSVTQYRRLRQLQSQSKLPGILWGLLVVGGILTTLSSCLFGTDNFKLHAIQVFSLSFLLSLTLVAIADIDRPFRGAVHVSPMGFERARDTFAEYKTGSQ